jgi:GNAT superfamily N-acetyltransferase
MGRNNPDFHTSSGNSEYSLSFIPGNSDPLGGQSSRHEVQAHTADGKHVGSLTWSPAWEGTIHDVHVDPAHRRRGLATKMLEMAKSTGHPISHSTFRTKEGDKWAGSVGDKLPPKTEWKRPNK